MKPFLFLSITLLASAIFTSPVPAQNSAVANSAVATPFADVPSNHWAAAAVKRLAELGIVEGFPGEVPNRQPIAKTIAPTARTAKSMQVKSPIKSASATKAQKAKTAVVKRATARR